MGQPQGLHFVMLIKVTQELRRPLSSRTGVPAAQVPLSLAVQQGQGLAALRLRAGGRSGTSVSGKEPGSPIVPASGAPVGVLPALLECLLEWEAHLLTKPTAPTFPLLSSYHRVPRIT